MPARDLYEILQVHHSAAPKVIQTAYRRLAKIYHPDVNSDPAAATHMKEINLAYELLNDPVRRVQYDRGRRVPASPPFRSRPERSSYRRGWNPWPYVEAVLSGPSAFDVVRVVVLGISASAVRATCTL
jgi:curved DNA-binding protein CbpA